MSKRNDRDYRQNSSVRKGIVVDRDPKKKRVKVLFGDEDETVSYWIDVTSKSSTVVKTFIMPGKDDEVWCAIDAKGESGCVIGSRFNDKDTPSHASNDDIALTFPGGSIHINGATGALTVSLSGTLTVTAAQVVLDAEVDLGGEGGQLLHRQGDADTGGDLASGAASRVRAV